MKSPLNQRASQKKKTNQGNTCVPEKHTNPSEDSIKNNSDTEEFTRHDQTENNVKTDKVPVHDQTKNNGNGKQPDGMTNKTGVTSAPDNTDSDTAQLPHTNVIKLDDTIITNVSVENNEKMQKQAKPELGNMKKQQMTQPKYKQMSELRLLAKARRRVATLERRKAQKEYHFLAKKLEKINTTIEEECKAIQKELLIEYDNVFSAKLTRDQRIRCEPVKLELVKNTEDLPKPNRATAHRCPINLRKSVKQYRRNYSPSMRMSFPPN